MSAMHASCLTFLAWSRFEGFVAIAETSSKLRTPGKAQKFAQMESKAASPLFLKSAANHCHLMFAALVLLARCLLTIISIAPPCEIAAVFIKSVRQMVLRCSAPAGFYKLQKCTAPEAKSKLHAAQQVRPACLSTSLLNIEIRVQS